jgi:type IV secretion system protein VirB4
MHEAIPISLGVAATISSAAVAGGLLCSEKLRHKLCPPIVATYLSDSLEFDQVGDDDCTIIGKTGTLTRTYEIHGKDYNICTTGELERLFKQRQFLWNQLAESALTFKIIIIREEIERGFDGTYDNEVLQEIHDRWMKSFKRTFRNRYYLIVTAQPKVTRSFKTRFRKQPQGGNRAQLDDLCLLIENTLSEFDIRLLRNTYVPESELLSFWATILNGCHTPVRYYRRHLSDRLVRHSLTFDKKGLLRLEDGRRTTYGTIFSLQTWGEESSSQLFRELMAIEGRMIFLNLLQGVPKVKAMIHLEDQRRQQQFFFSSDKTESEFTVAKQIIEGNDGSLYRYQFSVLLLADQEEELEKLIQEVRRVFLAYGVIAVQEQAALEYMWRSFLPGDETFVRASHLLSHNLAHLLTFDRESIGSHRSDWGVGPLRYLKTLSGGTYGFNLHISENKEELGHSLVVAPAGSGKTTLIQHLIAGALRHPDLRVYIFDRFNGTRIFTEACGGNYIDFKDNDVKLNPFVVEDTVLNRSRLRQLLSLMAGMDDIDVNELDLILSLLMATPPDKRLLKACESSLFGAHSQLAHKLRQWSSGAYQHWFNGERDGLAFDALDLNSSRLVGFEMTAILNEQRTVAPLTFYIMERIREQVREHATPHWLFIDETKPMANVPFFKGYLEVALKEARKLRGVVTLCFQSVNDIVTTGISDVIVQNCKTKLFFPNPEASEYDLKYYQELFNFTQSELEYIAGRTKATKGIGRTVLLKKPGESVVLNIDLAPLGSYVKLYKSGSEFINQVTHLKAEKGNQWLESYLHSS